MGNQQLRNRAVLNGDSGERKERWRSVGVGVGETTPRGEIASQVIKDFTVRGQKQALWPNLPVLTKMPHLYWSLIVKLHYYFPGSISENSKLFQSDLMPFSL